MGYQEEFNRLQKIITSDASSEEQREKARDAKKKLIDGEIDQAFIAFEKRTKEYEQFLEKLKDIVDRIAANQLTTVIKDLDGIVKDIKDAAKGP
jgi:predicted transcriptional regulator